MTTNSDNVNHNNYKLVSVQLSESMYSTLINDNDDDDYSVIIWNSGNV